MRHVNGLSTQRCNRAHRRDGPLFRGRYKAIVVDAEAYLARVIRYIHLNPVQAKLVQSPEAYRWSSHGRYLTPRSAPPWLGVREVLDSMGHPASFMSLCCRAMRTHWRPFMPQVVKCRY